MFTSRAEFRLSLRADNADQRLTPLGVARGCVSEARRIAFDRKASDLSAARYALEQTQLTPHEVEAAGIKVSQDGVRRSALQLLAFPNIDIAIVSALCPAFAAFNHGIKDQVSKDALYAQYLDRQANDAASLQREEGYLIPDSFDYSVISGLSTELKQKLQRQRPHSLFQAGRIEGMTPAALTLILAFLRRSDRKSAVQ